MMTADQQTAFSEATGSNFTADAFLLVVQSIGVTFILVYVAWIILRAYNDFGKEFTKSRDVVTTWARAILMLMIFTYLLIN